MQNVEDKSTGNGEGKSAGNGVRRRRPAPRTTAFAKASSTIQAAAQQEKRAKLAGKKKRKKYYGRKRIKKQNGTDRAAGEQNAAQGKTENVLRHRHPGEVQGLFAGSSAGPKSRTGVLLRFGSGEALGSDSEDEFVEDDELFGEDDEGTEKEHGSEAEECEPNTEDDGVEKGLDEEVAILLEFQQLTARLDARKNELITTKEVKMLQGLFKNVLKRKTKLAPEQPVASGGDKNRKGETSTDQPRTDDGKKGNKGAENLSIKQNPRAKKKNKPVCPAPEVVLDAKEPPTSSLEASEPPRVSDKAQENGSSKQTKTVDSSDVPAEPRECAESPGTAENGADLSRRQEKTKAQRSEAEDLVSKGLLVKGKIRINPSSPSTAFVTSPGMPVDIVIRGTRARNRAFHGDDVAVRLDRGKVAPATEAEPSESEAAEVSDSEVTADEVDAEIPPGDAKRQEGSVVCILREKTDARTASGVVKCGSGRPIKEGQSVLEFHPADKKAPIALVGLDMLQNVLPGGEATEEALNGSIFVVKYGRWRAAKNFPFVDKVTYLGRADDVTAQTSSIVRENQISDEDFTAKVLSCLPNLPFEISETELENRRDLRSLCVVSIDPETARDLDDALSFTQLEDGLVEIGVHIADVSHFVKAGTALDLEARNRCTSVYLVQRVIPMLPRGLNAARHVTPRLLCEDLCSLNPNVERLSFSVFWHMDQDGKIEKTWFGRSVIRSCCRLTYEQAQRMIDKQRDDLENLDDVETSNGFALRDVVDRVRLLHGVAQKLRKRRFDDGALRLHSDKLSFKLDSKRETPLDFAVYELRESNFLVEEFMLLANMSVARYVSDVFPQFAPLRRHPPPLENMMGKLADLTESSLNVKLQYGTSKQLQETLELLQNERDPLTSSALQMMLTKPMQEAMYFCTKDLPEEDWFHFGLCVPRYTHFTSPIRRYVDVLVHRVLQAAIDKAGHEVASASAGRRDHPLTPLLRRRVLGEAKADMAESLERCNEKKRAAKTAELQSQEMFLRMLLGRAWKVVPGVVTEIRSQSMVIYAPSLCYSRSFFYDRIEEQGCAVDFNEKSVSVGVNSAKWREQEKQKEQEKEKKKRRRRPKGDKPVKQTVVVDEQGTPLMDVRESAEVDLTLRLFSPVKLVVRAQDNIREDLDVRLCLC